MGSRVQAMALGKETTYEEICAEMKPSSCMSLGGWGFGFRV